MTIGKNGPVITIPFPRTTSNVNRGYIDKYNRKRYPETKPTTIRFTEEDRWHIDKIANQLGMSFGEFVRWCAYYGAIESANYALRNSFQDEKRKSRLVDTSGFE